MHRFALFVDGSNQFGSLKTMNVHVDNYEIFYRFIFEKALEVFRTGINTVTATPAQLYRVYWYEVGKMDEWDLADPKAQAHLRKRFDEDREVRRAYMALAGPKHPSASQDQLATEAWAMCFKEFKEWYESKKKTLEGMRKFHHGVRSSTDFIDIIECGHWKVDFLHKVVSEKGLDTTLAVDMVTMQNNYDVAIVLSGDADSIPSINYVKACGKHVAAVEFLNGYPPESRGKQFSSRLKIAADFVVQIFEMDLVSKGLARKVSDT